MSVHTRTRHTKRKVKRAIRTKVGIKPRVKERSIPWRESLKEHLDKYGEPAVMLRGSRHKKELTQQELADAIGISQHHISEMENGKRSISKEMAKKLGEFFKVDYRRFL